MKEIRIEIKHEKKNREQPNIASYKEDVIEWIFFFGWIWSQYIHQLL